MLLLGKHITTPEDPLQPVEVEKVFRAILNPKSEVAILQKRLQTVKMLDVQQYRKLKTNLPYLVCAHFNPRIRRKENFVYTKRFIVDIDHLSAFEIDMGQLKNKLKSDQRIELMFTSPGGDGLKIFFKLKQPINDTGYYSLFYKSFCLKFAGQYDLGGAVDSKTSDVSRCCFVSHDPEAYFNPMPEEVDASVYIPAENDNDLDFFKKKVNDQEKENDALRKESGITPTGGHPLTEDILTVIKTKVGMRVRKKAEKEYEQPEELDNLMAEVAQLVSEVGVSMVSTAPISYGRKIRMAAGSYWAEINLFYGQRGVSIVGTTKTGSNKELCNSMVELLKSHFNP